MSTLRKESEGVNGNPQAPQKSGDRSQGREEVAVHYKKCGSYCPLSDHHFAESVAADIIESIEAYHGCMVIIGCYTPPYDPPLEVNKARSGGFLTLDFIADSQEPACISIEFGRADSDGAVVRAAFDADLWKTDPSNPLYSGIYAANFDEAWRIVCLTVRLIEAKEVSLRYGC